MALALKPLLLYESSLFFVHRLMSALVILQADSDIKNGCLFRMSKIAIAALAGMDATGA